MEIIVHGRHLELDDERRREIEGLVAHAARVFEQAVDSIDVEVSEEANPRLTDQRAQIELTAAVSGRVVRIEAAATTVGAAVDDAVDRLTRQIRRLKERLIDRNRQAGSPPEERAGGGTSGEVVRVKQFVMKPMTIEEAILQMEMLEHSFFFFRQADSGDYAVLYRRRDGRLGLIEPS